MLYKLQFGELLPYWDVLLQGLIFTIVLTVVSTLAGIAVGTADASARTFGPKWLGGLVAVYVELIRNTPFIVQLFFIFFGLPALGIKLNETTAVFLAMVINLGAYSTEIIRAGIEAVPKGHIEAGISPAMTKWEVLRHIILKQAFQKIYPAQSSQIIIVMLGSAVVSQISAQDLTYAANFIASRNFRNFEVYLLTRLRLRPSSHVASQELDTSTPTLATQAELVALAYLLLAMLTRSLLRGLGRILFKAK
jgi:polar amino acid transport system permease protein